MTGGLGDLLWRVGSNGVALGVLTLAVVALVAAVMHGIAALWPPVALWLLRVVREPCVGDRWRARDEALLRVVDVRRGGCVAYVEGEALACAEWRWLYDQGGWARLLRARGAEPEFLESSSDEPLWPGDGSGKG